MNAEIGYDVLVNRAWYPINPYQNQGWRSVGTRLAEMKIVQQLAPALITPNVAHVCAYTTGGGFCRDMRVECAILNIVRV